MFTMATMIMIKTVMIPCPDDDNDDNDNDNDDVDDDVDDDYDKDGDDSLSRCHSYDWGETGSGVCRLSHHT